MELSIRKDELHPTLHAPCQSYHILGETADDIAHHRPAVFDRASSRFRAGNELTAVMNATGDPDCLLSPAINDRNPWLAQVTSEGNWF
jgi:hypothetical protein